MEHPVDYLPTLSTLTPFSTQTMFRFPILVFIVFFYFTTINLCPNGIRFEAFGNNLIEVEPKLWAIYTGDMNQDGIIDNDDFSIWEADANNFISGYSSTDLNGTGNVENGDFSLWELNANEFVGVVKP